MKEQTKRALEMVLNGATPYAAAKACKVAQSTVHRALEREKEERCKSCGRRMPKDKEPCDD